MTAIEKYIETMKSTGRKLYRYSIISKRGGIIFSYSVWEYPCTIEQRVKAVCESLKGHTYSITEID